jgi:hypothetical protein
MFWAVLWASLAARTLKVGGRFYMFSDWRQLPAATDVVQAAGLMWRGVVVWDKGRGSRAPHTGYHRHMAEYIVFATKGKCGGPFEGVIRTTIPATVDKRPSDSVPAKTKSPPHRQAIILSPHPHMNHCNKLFSTLRTHHLATKLPDVLHLAAEDASVHTSVG